MSYGSYPIVEKLELCSVDLSIWNQNHFQQLMKEINDCRKQIEVLRVQVDSSNIAWFNNLRNRMNRLLIQEDAFWRQMAKTHWLRDGDLNTKFFHAAATSRKKMNIINSLVDSNNVCVTDEEQFCAVAKNYFNTLFIPQVSDTTPVIAAIHESITVEDNNSLTVPFVIDEFKAAVFSMKPAKCAGPDSFNPGFFQKFWPICGEEFFNQCCDWLATGNFPSALNSTNIALIPKGNSQISMKDWRPIALCNVLYKVVAKVLANQLKVVLDKCISECQSAFVPGRSILDNAMAAIEIIHHMKIKVKGNVGEVH